MDETKVSNLETDLSKLTKPGEFASFVRQLKSTGRDEEIAFVRKYILEHYDPTFLYHAVQDHKRNWD
ncbi:hypothetical protein ACFL0X_02810 [Nanoarchaeota archaeon]